MGVAKPKVQRTFAVREARVRDDELVARTRDGFKLVVIQQAEHGEVAERSKALPC